MREYLQPEAFFVDCVLNLLLLVWIYTWSASWLVTIRPEVNRCSVHGFILRRAMTIIMSQSLAILSVITINIVYAAFLAWSIYWVNNQLKLKEIRALQIVISRSSIEVRKIYRALSGQVTRCSPSSPRHLSGNHTCPICLDTLVPSKKSSHVTITAYLRHPRQHLSSRDKPSQGVLTIHTTPCGHNYHENCLTSVPSRYCPLCKAPIGRTSLIALPYLPW